jgi:O-antigen ligase
MTPPIALLLCTIFVLFLLRLDSKQFPNASWSLWIPTVWMLAIASRGLNFWFGSGVEDIEDGGGYDRVFQLSLLLIGVMLLARRRFKWSAALKYNWWVILLVAYMLISVLWTDAPLPSFKRWVRQLVAVGMAFLVASEDEPRLALESVFRRTVYILIPFSLLVIEYYPHIGVQDLRGGDVWWQGLAVHKNSMARFCVVAILFMLWAFTKRWRGIENKVVWYQPHVEIVVFLVTLYLFMGPKHTLTYSATSTVSLAVGVTGFIWLLWLKRRGKIISANSFMIIIGTVITLGIVSVFTVSSTLVDVSSLLGRSETLTGRTEIWSTLVPFVGESPIFGLGLGRTPWGGNPHNGYLYIVLSLGFVGFALLCLFLLSSSRRAQRELTVDFDWGILWSCGLVMAVVHNIAESTMSSFGNPLSALLLLMYVGCNADNYRGDVEKRYFGPAQRRG